MARVPGKRPWGKRGKEGTTTLYRPVGGGELQLIGETGFREFPPRLPGQTTFYPVVTLEYAEQVARDWNARDKAAGYRGFVTRFRVDSTFLAGYPQHQVGNSIHREYWIPAGDLAEFNRHIRGLIEVVAEFHGGPDNAA
jgi:hypothetical protein